MQEQALRDGAFQSTPSAWRETAYRFYKIRIEEHFNPLPPHGGRRGRMYCRKRCMNFNPLPPYGGRPVEVFPFVRRNCISIHSLRMEGDSAV